MATEEVHTFDLSTSFSNLCVVILVDEELNFVLWGFFSAVLLLVNCLYNARC